jgi:hypothetical protein
MDWTVFAPVLVEHLALPVLLAVGGWIVTKLPGPVRDALQASVHSKDMALLLGALTRGAVAAYKDYEVGKIQSPGAAIQAVVTYVLTSIPDTVAKLGPSREVLTTMAHAAWDQWVVQAKAAEAPAVVVQK